LAPRNGKISPRFADGKLAAHEPILGLAPLTPPEAAVIARTGRSVVACRESRLAAGDDHALRTRSRPQTM
jgi:hypothetical protein